MQNQKRQAALGVSEDAKRNPKNTYVTQKRAIVVIAILVAVLAAAFVISGIIADIYTFSDADGQTYTIKKHDGEYALFKDGNLCDTGVDKTVVYYVTELGTQVQIDPATGECTVYAVVDTEDTEEVRLVGNAASVLMFKQLTYDRSSTNDSSRIIKSIEMHNQYSSYTVRRDNNNSFYIEGHETAILSEELFAQLSSGCGYTISTQRLESPKRLPDGTIDYAEYGLAPEIRVTEDEDGEPVTYDYVPTRYTITTMNDDTYTVTLGDATVSENGYYARCGDRNTVYILPSVNLKAAALQPVEALVTPMLVYPMSSTDYVNVTDFTYRSNFDYDSIIRDLYAAVLGEDVWDPLPETGEELTAEQKAYLTQLQNDYAEASANMSAEEFADLYAKTTEAHSKLVTKFDYLDISDRTNTLYEHFPYQMSSDYMAGYLPHSDNIHTMLNLIHSMTFTGVTVLSPTTEQLAEYGLEAYAHEISFIYTDADGNRLSNYFTVSEKTEDGLYFAYAPIYDMIVCFTESQGVYLEWDEIMWYDRNYFQVSYEYIKSLTVEGAGIDDPLVFTLDYGDATPSTENLTVYVNGQHLDYTILYAKSPGNMEQMDADANFMRLLQAFLTASLEGVADLTDAEMANLRATPDEDCFFKFTVIAEDSKGNSRYQVYRFYQYTERKAYLTVEVLDSPDAPSDPTRAEGRFYVLRSFCDKLIADVDRFMNGVEIVVDSKN